MIRVRRFSRTDYIFLLYLLTLVVVYSIYFLSFTLFDGFTTFANDAASYVLLARKWSPFFAPSIAELQTWPVQTFPPGFSWVLAITGTSESLWSGHLLVSVCMLASISLFGWMAYRQLGWLIGGLLTFGLCLLPGAVISSMGILSENLYLFLSLAVLLLYSYIRKNENASWAWYLLLLFFLSLTILTRAVGIALVAAIFMVPVFDGELPRRQKIVFPMIALSGIVVWQLWRALDPQSHELLYNDYLVYYISAGEAGFRAVLEGFWHNIQINFLQILSSWNHYFSLSHSSVWFFIFSYFLILISLIGLSLRLYQRKLDAVYLAFYLTILLIWRFPEEMTRFLHPIVFLVILQPVLYFTNLGRIRYTFPINMSIIAIILILIVNSIIIQGQLLELRDVARKNFSNIAHAYEYYSFPTNDEKKRIATLFAHLMRYMAASSERIPIDSVVASVKHTNYAILADRKAVQLAGVVTHLQQLCNLKIKNVDVVYLSPLTNSFNKRGMSMIEQYQSISSEVWSMRGEDGQVFSYVLTLDRAKVDSELLAEGFECKTYQIHFYPHGAATG